MRQKMYLICSPTYCLVCDREDKSHQADHQYKETYFLLGVIVSDFLFVFSGYQAQRAMSANGHNEERFFFSNRKVSPADINVC